jgi:Tfp pilus assembly protein PilV
MRYTQHQSKLHARGYSLIEVLLAVSLSFLSITALTQLYLHFHHVFVTLQNSNYQQKTAQVVMALLEDEISHAGHIGCAKLTDDFHVEQYGELALTSQNALVVADNQLEVRYQSQPNAELQEDLLDDLRLIADVGERFYANHYLLISDCQHAEIFQAASVRLIADKQIIISRSRLRHHYQRYAQIGRYIQRRFQIENRHQVAYLMRRDSSDVALVVAAGIPSMQFSRDQHGVAYQFVTMQGDVQQKWYGYAEK